MKRYIYIHLLIFAISLCVGCRSSQHTVTDISYRVNDTVEVVRTDTVRVVIENRVRDTVSISTDTDLKAQVEEYYDENGRLQKRITTQSAHITSLTSRLHEYELMLDSLRSTSIDSVSISNHEENTFIDNEEPTSIDSNTTFIDRVKRRISQELALFGFAFLMFFVFRRWIRNKV